MPEKSDLTSLDTEEGNTISLFHSMFFSAFPIGSDDRVALISFTTLIALTWIIHHEAAHARNGHFRLLHPSVTATEGAGLFRVGEFQSDRNSRLASSVPLSALELQADILATKQTIRCFFTEEWAKDLPSYACRSPAWLARLIATSIGVVTMIFEKRRQLDGVLGDYPTPMSRLGAILCTSLQVMPKLVSDPACWTFKSPNTVELAVVQVTAMIANGSMFDIATASSFLEETISTFDGPVSQSLKEKYGDSYNKLQSSPGRALYYPFPIDISDGAELIPYAEDICIMSDIIGPSLITPYESKSPPNTPYYSNQLNLISFKTSNSQEWFEELRRLIEINVNNWDKFKPIGAL